MPSLAEKIAEAKRALREAGKTGYGDETDGEAETTVTQSTAAPQVTQIQEPQEVRYVTVHRRVGKPIVHDLITGQSREMTFKK